MRDIFIFLDAETDGLYGPFISVALVVMEAKGDELARYYFGIDKDIIQVENKWVEENVLPYMGEYEVCKDENELIRKTWEVWQRYETSAYMVADVCFPVEARLLYKAVLNDVDSRAFHAPYPLLDLSSMLYGKGLDPLTARETIVKQKPEGKLHNPLYDVLLMIDIWKHYILSKDV